MRAITKTFPGVVALKDVSLQAYAGEVLALMGENGAGKSTLMKVLGGAHQPDSGEIRIDDKPVELRGVRDAQRHGIRLIHQELMLAQNLDIAANLFLGSEPGSARVLRRLPRREMANRAKKLLPRVGLDLSPQTRVASLTAGQLQMVEIAKALALEARVIIMDEPTSSLTATESEHLFRIIGELSKSGIAIIYISHRLEEVMRLADRISVLRDGQHVGDLDRKDATVDRLVQMMVGREMTGQYFPKRVPKPPGDVLLDVRDLVVPGSPVGVSFQALRGEILGFAGLVGAGRTELMSTLFGVTPALAGTATLGGEPFAPQHPKDAIARGVFLAPEDRKRHGLVVRMTVAENTSLPSINSFNRWGLLERKKEQHLAEAEVKRLRIKARNIYQKVMNLSGGNQQKIVLGKWLALAPKLLMLDEPTRGIDVGAKAEIYQHMATLAASGITILMVSSDLEEILGMSDRVLVMHERRVRGILGREEISVEGIATLMTGAKQKASATAAATALLSPGGLTPGGRA
jgi:ribose transport system ATP-binding protein